MIQVQVYIYDSAEELNGYRGEDLSAYVAQASTFTEDLTLELDTAEITLYGYDRETPFPPMTKLIVDRYENDILIDTLHFIVEHDYCQPPQISDEGYFNHTLFLIEPSAVAQKRVVDNIAATYKLKDVSLKQTVAYDISQYADFTGKNGTAVSGITFGQTTTHPSLITTKKIWSFGKYFVFDDVIYVSHPDGTGKTNLKYAKVSDFPNGVKFWLPNVRIYGGVEGTNNYIYMGNASIDYKIEEIDALDDTKVLNTITGSLISNSNMANKNVYGEYGGEWLIENVQEKVISANLETAWYRQYRKYTETTAPNIAERTTSIINLSTMCNYKVTITLHDFADSFPDTSPVSTNEKYAGSNICAVLQYYEHNKLLFISKGIQTLSIMTEPYISASSTFTAWNTTDDMIFLKSSVPYSALNLLQKAIVNSGTYLKESGEYIGDVNSNIYPFYIDDAYVNELAATQVIENFYNQKNLWEIMVEIGYYIHAVPEIKFGADDRFLITFNKLGITDTSEEKGEKSSIYSFRGIDDYISETSSYITNMVQLGGVIKEWVSLKTQDESFLVYNDTAEIMTSKPITELLSIKVRCDSANYTGMGISQGDIGDLTPYVFEKNVWQLLSVEYTDLPNKGIGLYYTLGEKSIKNGDYELPQANTTAYSTINLMKVIYLALKDVSPYSSYNAGWSLADAEWNNIFVNDFSFFITYRTKDDVRQVSTRPDIRKYLLSSKYDKYPQQIQFNNQQDTLVDSIKFGRNMYGKLIRTGNNQYNKSEWVDSLLKIKRKGELYKIDNDLYYVAKVKHTIYSNYIISEVEFSKDYNQLSQIIGIPSEPRFYEISEQSQIRREVAINDFIILTTDINKTATDILYNENKETFILDIDHIFSLITSSGSFAKYAVTTFKGDADANVYDQANGGDPEYYKDILMPVNAYSSMNTLTYEWDMKDNFGAGDKVEATVKNHYNTLKAVQYNDVYGKSALMDFYVLNDDLTLAKSEVMALPESPISTKKADDDTSDTSSIVYYKCVATNRVNRALDDHSCGLGLLKDSREAISINYNTRLITDSDLFILSPFLFSPNKINRRLVFLNKEVNKLTNGWIDVASIIDMKDANDVSLGRYFTIDAYTNLIPLTGWRNNINYRCTINTPFAQSLANNNLAFTANDKHFNDEGGNEYQRVKAVALICDVSLTAEDTTTTPQTTPNKVQLIMARNIPETYTKGNALAEWYIGRPKKETIFTNYQ